MKLRFKNGFSISLWNEEVEEVEISDTYVKYKASSCKVITIRIPSTWSKEEHGSDITCSTGSCEDESSKTQMIRPTKEIRKEIPPSEPKLDMKYIDAEIEKVKKNCEN